MGWSWGGFGLNWIWAIANKTWIGLLALIPCVNIFIAIWLGISGHKLAWQNRRFDSLQQFQETMKAWNLWGLIIFLVSIALNVVSWLIQAATNR
ncbi:MAG: ribonuclease G [Armatimonadetes bacterium]|nr:ribonuclease G [Armatimonadota bacterium]